MNIIEVKDLNFSYVKSRPVLKNFNLEIKNGEFIALVGGNGSGKSTLVKNLLGELKPDSGTVKILNKNISEYTSYKEIGYVPQVNIVENIAFPVTTKELVALNLYEDFGFLKYPKKKHYKKAEDILTTMGLEIYLNTPVNELSGGLKQRTMIARALINEPKILILDEPTAGVDQLNREEFYNLLENINQEYDITILLITHELEELRDFVSLDKIFEISDGHLEEKTLKDYIEEGFKC